MSGAVVVPTSLGDVEVLVLPGRHKPPVLLFPGGHCSAVVDCGRSVYTALGHGVVAFSRPGYGRTDVGRLTAEEFVPAVAECCRQLAIDETAAAVGVSFGGLQAVQAAIRMPELVPRLVLHSCAPSALPYPDSGLERIGGPVAFGPALQGLVWALIRRLVSTDAGLRRMVSALSSLPVDDWWQTWTPHDRARARELFRSMRSDSGFVIDLGQGRRDRATYRSRAQASVPSPTLVTASRHDAGVAFAHAANLAETIPGARLVELDAPSHLFWLGPSGAQVQDVVAEFLESAPDVGR